MGFSLRDIKKWGLLKRGSAVASDVGAMPATMTGLQTVIDGGSTAEKAALSSSVSQYSGALLFIKPSGDTAGVTDPANYAAAVAQLPVAGGTVCMLPGTYYTRTNFAPGRDNVKTQAFMRHTAKIVAVAPWVPSPNQSATGVFSFTGTANGVVDGLWIDLATNNVIANGIEICRNGLLGQGAPSTNCVVSNNKVTGSAQHIYQIWNHQSNGTKIFGNLIDGGLPTPQTGEAATQEGIEIYGGLDVEVYGNIINNCGANGIYSYTHIGDTAGCVLDGINIHDNVVSNCWNGINLASSYVGGADGYARNVHIKNNTINKCWNSHIYVDWPFSGASMRNIEICGNVGVGATTAEGAIPDVKAFLFNNQFAASAIKLEGKFLVADNAFTDFWPTVSGGVRKIYGMPGGEFRGNTWGLSSLLATGTARVGFMYGSSGVREVGETYLNGRYYSVEYISTSGFSVSGSMFKDWNRSAAGTSAVIVNASCTDFVFADCQSDTSTPTNIANIINLGSAGIRRFEIRGLRYLNTGANRGNIGQASFNADTIWAASTAYTLTSSIRPTAGGSFYYQCITGGTSGATEPTWPTAVGSTVSVGGATFICRSVWE